MTRRPHLRAIARSALLLLLALGAALAWTVSAVRAAAPARARTVSPPATRERVNQARANQLVFERARQRRAEARPVAAGPLPAGRPGGAQTRFVPSVASCADQVLFAWIEESGELLPACSYSLDGGQTFAAGPTPPAPAGWTWAGHPVVTAGEKSGVFYLCSLLDQGLGRNGVAVVPARFTGGALSWGAPILVRSLHTRAAVLERPWLAADSTSRNLYLACTTFDAATGAHIDFQRSRDGGTSWSEVAQISAIADQGRVHGARLAVGPGGELHAVWSAIATGEPAHLRVRKSETHGASWEREVTVAARSLDSTGAPGFRFPSIAVDRTSGAQHGRVHLAWADSLDVLSSHSNDGTRWSAPVGVSDTPAGTGDLLPEVLVAADGMPYVSWFEGRDDGPRLRLSRSSDGGATWFAAPRFVDTQNDRSLDHHSTQGPGGAVRLWADARYLRAAWVDRRGNASEIRAIRIDTWQQLTARQGDLGADPGTTIDPSWSLANRSRWFASSCGWTLSSQRNWPLTAVGAVAVAADGAATIAPTIAIPDSAAPGVNRLCLTVANAKGTRSQVACFDLTVQARPAGEPTVAAAFDLRAIAPDPASNATRVEFSLPYSGPVRLGIYGLRGERVRTLLDGERRAGPNVVTWDGRDDRGDRAVAGAYFCRLEGYGKVRVQRLVWLR